jgi:uncharacterized membrane protein
MSNPQATAKIGGHPLHPMLIPFPIAGFVGALVCDLIGTADPFWLRPSEYLLGVGVVMALLAAVMGFTDFMGDARIRALPVAWAHFVGNLIVVLIEALVRAGSLLMLVTGGRWSIAIASPSQMGRACRSISTHEIGATIRPR